MMVFGVVVVVRIRGDGAGTGAGSGSGPGYVTWFLCHHPWKVCRGGEGSSPLEVGDDSEEGAYVDADARMVDGRVVGGHVLGDGRSSEGASSEGASLAVGPFILEGASLFAASVVCDGGLLRLNWEAGCSVAGSVFGIGGERRWSAILYFWVVGWGGWCWCWRRRRRRWRCSAAVGGLCIWGGARRSAVRLWGSVVVRRTRIGVEVASAVRYGRWRRSAVRYGRWRRWSCIFGGWSVGGWRRRVALRWRWEAVCGGWR